MADPGFPVGVCGPVGGGGGDVDLRRGHFSVKMYAKMKELGPVGGGRAPLDPPMFNITRFIKAQFIAVYIAKELIR